MEALIGGRTDFIPGETQSRVHTNDSEICVASQAKGSQHISGVPIVGHLHSRLVSLLVPPRYQPGAKEMMFIDTEALRMTDQE